tara:strand:- start:213 stop:683 length:471 start_codon:yes stop_codon:yes gene_type:complete
MKVKLKTIFGAFRQPEWELNLIVHSLNVNENRNALVVSYDMKAFMEELKKNGQKTPLFCKRTNVNIEHNLKEFEKINREYFKEFNQKQKNLWRGNVRNPAWDVNPYDEKRNHLRVKWLKVNKEYKYSLIDGNHRAYALNKLYGGEHEVEILLTDSK